VQSITPELTIKPLKVQLPDVECTCFPYQAEQAALETALAA
jgi:hypothetical protein